MQARGLLHEALKAEPDNARVLQLLGSLEMQVPQTLSSARSSPQAEPCFSLTRLSVKLP